MNPRERVLAVAILLAIVLAGGGFLFHRLFLVPLQDREAIIQNLQTDLEHKRERIREVMSERPKFERWQQLSLPADIDLARIDYEKYLGELLQDSGFAPGSFSVIPKPPENAASSGAPASSGAAAKGAVYTRLTFTVMAHGKLESLVQALQDFYQTPLLHQIKNLVIQRPLTANPQQEAEDLDINVTIEALVIAGAGNRHDLLPNIDGRFLVMEAVAGLRQAPSGLALAAWAAGPTGPRGPRRLARTARDYAAIAGNNIFLANSANALGRREEVKVTRFVHLTNIWHDGRRREAFLYDRYQGKLTRLRAEAGFDSFRIMDDSGEPLLRGKVASIGNREVIFKVNERYYALHVGQNLEDSMRKALSAAQLRALLPPPETEKLSRRGQ